MPADQRIGLFGGTFDPIHLGHVEMAREAMNQLDLDQVRFIPCQISPHKNTLPTSASNRIGMVKLATASEPWAVVDDIETRQPGPSYSWKTAEALQQQFPKAKLFWIMGTDQWNNLLSWAEPKRLAQAVDFIVCTRGEAPREIPDFTCHTVVFDHPASATEIRNSIMNGNAKHPWLSPKVADYIQAQQLYQPS